MDRLAPLLMAAVTLLFVRACLVTLGVYKEPILTAFQHYGEEVGFSPLFDACVWGLLLVYMTFMILVPSPFLIIIGLLAFAVFSVLYWQVRDSVMGYPQLFLRYPEWYRDIVNQTTREERRKLAYMWLGLPLRTRLRYNAQNDAFRKWVELVLLSVA